MTEQQIDQQERELDSWMTRAYEAEGKLWQAEARIKAVREMHAPSEYGCQQECREDHGGIQWPCPTIRALESVSPPSA